MSETAESVQTSAPTSSDSMLERIEAQMFGEEPSSEVSQPESPEPIQAQDTEVEALSADDFSAEDIPETPTTAISELDLTYNGENVKVSLDEAKNFAQLGYHLQKQQDKVAAEFQAAREQAQRLQQFVEVQAKATPELRQADIEASSLAAQLQGIDQNALARLATDDPAQYVQVRAQIDQLQARFQQAVNRRNSAMQQFQQAQKGAQEALLAGEAQLLQKISPVFKDTTKAQPAIQKIGEVLKGMREQTVQAVSHNAELMAMALDAARYREAMANRREKLATAKQAPQMARPGPGTTPMRRETQDYLSARKAMRTAKSSTEKNQSILKMLESKF